jgi:hypothetical protein
VTHFLPQSDLYNTLIFSLSGLWSTSLPQVANWLWTLAAPCNLWVLGYFGRFAVYGALGYWAG